jgi:H+/Cl- antiporter ClcA
MRTLLRHKFVGVAWLFNAAFSVALVAASAEAVLRWAPAAAGSGVPEVMAQLNGCKLPRVRWRAIRVAAASCGLCRGARARNPRFR